MDFDGSIEVPAGQELQLWTLTLPARPGVYLLWGQAHEPILLSTSGSVRAVVRRKLSPNPEDIAAKRADLAKITKGVSWTQADSNFVAYLQFHRLAREIYPQTYRETLGWHDPWWVRVNMSDPFGRLLTTRKLSWPGPDEFVGPWPNARSAGNFIDVATDLFSFCRNYELLQRSVACKGGTVTCTYAQMDKCCGLCEGKISAQEYRGRLIKAARLTEPEFCRQLQADLEKQMQAAAADMNFEEAGKLKDLLARLKDLFRDDFRWADNLRRFAYLVIAPGKDRHQLRPWRVVGGTVQPGEPFALAELDQQLPEILNWAGQARDLRPEDANQLQQWCETVSLVSYFLFRSHSDKCLYYRLSNLPSIEEMVEQIEKRFTRPSRPKVKPDDPIPETDSLKKSPQGQ